MIQINKILFLVSMLFVFPVLSTKRPADAIVSDSDNDGDDVDPSGYEADDERDDLPLMRHAANKGVVVVPVADLVTEPLSAQYADVEQAYKNIPISWGPLYADKRICPRQHQALFNEVVTVLEEHEHELCIELNNVVSTDEQGRHTSTRYWTLKKNITMLEHIPQQAHRYIPTPLSSTQHDLHAANMNIITLAYPFHDPATRQQFSVGTRFAYVGSDQSVYVTYVYNHRAPGMQKLTIPKRYCILGSPQSHALCLSNFVKIARNWARLPGFIPLVWGGASCAQRVNMEGFALKQRCQDGQEPRGYWELDAEHGSPHTGFDGSGLVLRAAQVCGLAYFCKNSTDALRSLPHIEPGDLQEGDMLWIPGGLLIVSDIADSKIIGTFGYQFGYGRVMEFALSDLFDGIATYADLAAAYNSSLPLGFKDNSGTVVRTVPEYCFLRFTDCGSF